MNLTSQVRGDIYVASGSSRAHPVASQISPNTDGIVFACLACDTAFPPKHLPENTLLCSAVLTQSSSGAEIGYSDIETAEPERARPTPTPRSLPIGVFIPQRVPKRQVADDLRARFGQGSILLKA